MINGYTYGRNIQNGGSGCFVAGVDGGFVAGYLGDVYAHLFRAFRAVVAHGCAREIEVILPHRDGEGNFAVGRGVAAAGHSKAIVSVGSVQHRAGKACGLECDRNSLLRGIGGAAAPVHELHLIINRAAVFHDGCGRAVCERRAAGVGEKQLYQRTVQIGPVIAVGCIHIVDDGHGSVVVQTAGAVSHVVVVPGLISGSVLGLNGDFEFFQVIGKMVIHSRDLDCE